MAMRVKNVAAGFYDATGFHPIRASSDYSPKRGGDKIRAPWTTTMPARRRKKKATGRKAKPKAHARRAFPTNIQPDTMRKHNPIPVKWATAKVRRLGNDVQVMLFPKATKRRAVKRAGRRVATRRAVRRRR